MAPIRILRIGRNEVGNFFGLARVADIVDAQPGVEVRQIGDVVAVFETGLMIRMMMVVRAEAAGFLVEIFQAAFRRRFGQWKERNHARLIFIADIDDARHVQIFVAVLADRFVVDQSNLASRQRQIGVDALGRGDAAKGESG